MKSRLQIQLFKPSYAKHFYSNLKSVKNKECTEINVFTLNTLPSKYYRVSLLFYATSLSVYGLSLADLALNYPTLNSENGSKYIFLGSGLLLACGAWSLSTFLWSRRIHSLKYNTKTHNWHIGTKGFQGKDMLIEKPSFAMKVNSNSKTVFQKPVILLRPSGYYLPFWFSQKFGKIENVYLLDRINFK
jgi:hypothetical protein